MDNENQVEYRSGFVAIAGKPNVGKSTLVNRIMGQELSIVTAKEQTTRNRISAIYTTDAAQVIFHDIPGLHDPKTPLNKSLVDTAKKALAEADVVLYMTPPAMPRDEDAFILSMLKTLGSPCVLAINKIDTVRREDLLPVIDAYSQAHKFVSVRPISAATGDGVDGLLEELIGLLPEGRPLFPEDDVSDLPTKFFVAELVRQQIIEQTGQEIPYKTAVVVESFKEGPTRVEIHADIHVERDSQKKIIVGKRGAMIKSIGTAARAKIQEFLGTNVRLDLFVKVTPNWTQKERTLREFGY